MKFFLAFPFLATALTLASVANEREASVRFSNGDQLAGNLLSLTTERLSWQSPLLEKPAPFFLKNVVELTLAAAPPAIHARHEATVSLTNGDLVRGQLVSVNDQFVELDTWFCGRLKFNRLMISDIRIRERPAVLYQGPSGLDGWTQTGKQAWTYQNSAFRSTAVGGIARDVALPDECSVAFDCAWKNAIAFKLVLFANDLTSLSSGAGYEINFHPRSVNVRGGKNRMIGYTQNAVALQENEKARIEIRTSLKSGKMCLFVDGELIDVWTDPTVDRKDLGRGIQFISSSAQPMQISRIEVGAWDGEVEQAPPPNVRAGRRPFAVDPGLDDEDAPEPVAEQKPAPGRMELRNGDSITGEVISIVDGTITVKTPFREVKLPVEVLRSVAMKTVELERCKRENGDVRGWFPDGSSLVFRLDAAGDGELTGSSQNFGSARFKLAAFSRIEFNIYDPDIEGLRQASGW